MKIFYLRNESGRAIACVAWDGKRAERIIFAVSTHNPIDPYNKEVGRSLAVGRFQFSPHALVLVAGLDSPFRYLLGCIAEQREFPTRTRNAAAAWLKNPPKPKKTKAA